MKKILLSFIFFLFIFNPFFLERINFSLAQEIGEPKVAEEVKNLNYPIPYIPVLKDLNYKPERSALLKTENFLTGTLVFTGRYSGSSLVEFYRVQMRAQGWEEIGSFASKVIFLAFRRPEGYAFISISEGMILTEVRIVTILSGIK
ncbi:MAG: hypothetical protein N3A56_07115 [Thermodesulfobacteriaceae bacterium]|nr:hypothetical protein [Thermodesulfobacteriaceae bacterium]